MESAVNSRRQHDYSSVTPATGTKGGYKPIADSFANQMPTADTPAEDASPRAYPDKTIPGPEAASGLDAAAQEHIAGNMPQE